MNTQKEIKKIIFKHISPKDYDVFLFGSRVNKSHGKWSDYDIGVLGKWGQRLPAKKRLRSNLNWKTQISLTLLR